MLIVSNFAVTKTTPFTELSPYGLYIFNSENEYIKFGHGIAEIKTDNLRVNDISVLGNLYVYGTQVIGSTSTDLAGTTFNNFTIGTTTASGNTKLILGAYAEENSLSSNGSLFTFSKPVSLPQLTINGKLFKEQVIERLVLSNNLVQGVSVEIPNGKTYIIGSKDLKVFVDGLLQDLDDYNEVSTTQISFNKDLASGAKITFIIN